MEELLQDIEDARKAYAQATEDEQEALKWKKSRLQALRKLEKKLG